jgi:hypothetical protein
MDFQTVLDKVFSTWERDHHTLFNRCLKTCMEWGPGLYWTCAVRCHEYFNQTLPYEVEAS